MSADSLIDIIVPVAEAAGGVIESVQAAKAEEKTAKENARIEAENAAAAKRRYDYEAKIKREENERLSSKQRALYAKSGVEIDSGTPLLVLAEEARKMEEDALFIEEQGNVEYNAGMSRASIWNTRAREARRSGNVGAVGTILKSAKRLWG